MGMLDYLLVTPSNHRVHHAKNPRYIDKNYGGFLIVWDRLFGTFSDEQRDEKPIYGITHGLRSWNPIWANAVVWWDTLMLAVKAPRWRDKISVWFKGPGWFPQGLEPSREDPLGWHEHYDPQAPQSSKAYVFAQYWVLTGAGFALIASQAELAQPALVANFALIAGSMYVASLWLEHRQYRFWADGARAGLMLSAGLWMPLLSRNVAGWVWAVQVLGVANAVLLIGLYWLQQGQGETTAAN